MVYQIYMIFNVVFVFCYKASHKIQVFLDFWIQKQILAIHIIKRKNYLIILENLIRHSSILRIQVSRLRKPVIILITFSQNLSFLSTTKKLQLIRFYLGLFLQHRYIQIITHFIELFLKLLQPNIYQVMI